MAIEITGLNKKQRALADIMWGMNSKDEVLSFIRSLRGQNKQEAETVLEMMLWAVWDECGEITTDTKEVVDAIAKRR
jgi:hypothetical protein